MTIVVIESPFPATNSPNLTESPFCVLISISNASCRVSSLGNVGHSQDISRSAISLTKAEQLECFTVRNTVYSETHKIFIIS